MYKTVVHSIYDTDEHIVLYEKQYGYGLYWILYKIVLEIALTKE